MLLFRLSALFSLLFAACLGNELTQKWAIPDNIPETRVLTRSGCDHVGYQCNSCNQLSFCIETSLGFTELEADTCDTENGEYCSRSDNKCSTRKSFCSIGNEFICGEAGVYPDPFDCNVFYNCTIEDGAFVAHEQTCATGTVYNPRTYACDLSDADSHCEEYPVSECPEKGLTIAPLPENPNIYYACQSGIPQFFRCLQGEDYVFDASLFTCVYEGQQTTTPEPEPIIYIPEECEDGMFARIPYTCHNFMFCSSFPHPLDAMCDLQRNFYYDREEHKCLIGDCPYSDTWHLACPTTKLRPVAFSCNMYYNCTTTDPWDYIGYCDGHFDRDAGACSPDPKCPYTNL